MLRLLTTYQLCFIKNVVFNLYAAGWDGDSWIGGLRVNGRWRWQGNLTGEIQLAHWSSGELK